MTRTFFAMAVAGLLLAAVSGTSQAAPIAPLPAAAAADHSGVTQVYWHRWHRGWHRRCWRGRWGRVHCW
jgi:ABC-type glycerol-3-phosphate transport system substrate-binding protein